MTENAENTREDVVRQQSFESAGEVELDLGVGAGKIEVRLTDEPGVHVEVRHYPEGGSTWMSGMSSLLSWVSGRFGEELTGDVSPAEAVRQTRIDFSGGRLVVRTPKSLPLRTVPIAVTVRAPAGSHVNAQGGSADVTVGGRAGRLELSTGSGDINTDQASGVANVNTGSGTVRLGPMQAGLRAKTGAGDVEVASLSGATSLFTGSGDIWVGGVTGDMMARSGSGNLTVADASSGEIELQSGSGSIRVGVHAGCPADIDLSSATGDARSELSLSDTRPEGKPALRIRGRTASGSAIVSPAVTV